jgi:hypothetical protein
MRIGVRFARIEKQRPSRDGVQALLSGHFSASAVIA